MELRAWSISTVKIVKIVAICVLLLKPQVLINFKNWEFYCIVVLSHDPLHAVSGDCKGSWDKAALYRGIESPVLFSSFYLIVAPHGYIATNTPGEKLYYIIDFSTN